MRENDTVQLLLVDGKPSAVQLPAAVELDGRRHGAGREGRHRLERDQAGDARDRAQSSRCRCSSTSASASGWTRARRATSPARDPDRRHHASGSCRSSRSRARISTARVLEVAEILDGAGFAALEVPGGGCFDAAVRRGVESPWERIRGLRARCSKTPLQIALRGRFLVGSRPRLRRPDPPVHPLGRRERHRHLPPARPDERRREPRPRRRPRCARPAARLYAGLAFSGAMSNLERVRREGPPPGRARRRPRAAPRPGGRARPGDVRPGRRAACRGRPASRSGSTARARAGTRSRWRSRPLEHGAEPIATAAIRSPAR